MKYLLFIIGLSTISLNIRAQESDDITARVNISTRVIQSIELITVNSITFDNNQRELDEIHVNPVTDLNAGFMIALGTPGAEFRLEYQPERTLTRRSGRGSVTFRYELSGNTIEEQATSELIEFENRNLNFNENGRYYIWVGGYVDLRNALPGNYEGDFTIEIDYI